MNHVWIVEWFCSFQGWTSVNWAPLQTRKRARKIMQKRYRSNPIYRKIRFRVRKYVEQP